MFPRAFSESAQVSRARVRCPSEPYPSRFLIPRNRKVAGSIPELGQACLASGSERLVSVRAYREGAPLGLRAPEGAKIGIARVALQVSLRRNTQRATVWWLKLRTSESVMGRSA